MDRKGISFTLTVVVAGVILLMTALSIITLGGSSISNFFNTISGQQDQAVTSAEIEQACDQRAQRIQREYCSNYVKTSTYDADSSQWIDGVACSNDRSTRKAESTNAENGENAFERTASAENCPWGGINSGHSPTVNVGGNTYNCVDQGHFSQSCPVQ